MSIDKLYISIIEALIDLLSMNRFSYITGLKVTFCESFIRSRQHKRSYFKNRLISVEDFYFQNNFSKMCIKLRFLSIVFSRASYLSFCCESSQSPISGVVCLILCALFNICGTKFALRVGLVSNFITTFLLVK